jgi:hypothetical protein
VRRRRVAAGAAITLSIVAAAALALAMTADRSPEPAVTPAGAVTPAPVVLPTPTPAVAPAERVKVTAFQQALPDEVLAFAVSGQVEATDLLVAGAVEAWDLIYTDGARDVALRAAQWPTPEGAAAAMDAEVAALAPVGPTPTAGPSTAGPSTAGRSTTELLREGAVLVAGADVGRVHIVGDETTATAVWTNGSTLFRLEGPADVVGAFYDAFGM